VGRRDVSSSPFPFLLLLPFSSADVHHRFSHSSSRLPPSMATSPSILTSLNSDVLRVVLSVLLVDAPPTPHLSAVLRTCSTLHELGLPFLYTVVDLTGYKISEQVVAHWKSLFGQAGVLAKGGRTGGKSRPSSER